MTLTENAIYTHPKPIDRGHEVIDDASSPRSCICDVAEIDLTSKGPSWL